MTWSNKKYLPVRTGKAPKETPGDSYFNLSTALPQTADIRPAGPRYWNVYKAWFAGAQTWPPLVNDRLYSHTGESCAN